MKKLLLTLLTVVCAVSSSWATDYELVTSASQLVAGKNYIIASGTSGNVNIISTESNTNNRKTLVGTVSNGIITATDAMMVFELGGSSNAWTFTTTNYLGTDGYLYNSDTKNNRLFVGDNTTTNAFTITFANNTISSITCNGNTVKGVMCFNGTLVACYGSKSSGYLVPQLYVEVEEDPSVTYYNVTVANDIEHGSVQVSNSKVKEGATVTLTATPDKGYIFDSWNVTNASTSAAITVTDNKFTMPAANVNVSATFVEKPVNPNEIVFDFNDNNAYPAVFPISSGTSTTQPQTFVISDHNLVINAPDGYYMINAGNDASRGLFFGKTTANNNKPTEGTAYLGFPGIVGKKLVKVVVTTTNGVAGSVKMNIYDSSWATYSTEQSTTTSTKKEFTFNLSNTKPCVSYRLASGSSGKNLQFDNIVLTYEPVTSEEITVSAAGYATYYNNASAVTLPTGVEGYVWDNGLVKVYDAATSDNVIPADEPVVLKASAGTYTLNYTTTANATYKSIDSNDLCGAATDITAAEMATANPGANYFYALSLNASHVANSVGFYWINEGGAAFDLEAGKAYLVLPHSASPAKAFVFADESTGIQSVQQNAQNGVAYNLAGQRVAANAKGIVIMNGKKYLNK